MIVKSYKELKVWKNGILIVDCIYELTRKFPQSEQYNLIVHLQKTAISIPSNIAEGFARHYPRDFKRFLSISLGSCSELETQIIISQRRNYIEQVEYEKILEMLDYESRMLMKLIKSLKL